MVTHSSYLEAKSSLILDDEGMILAQGNCRMTNLICVSSSKLLSEKESTLLDVELITPKPEGDLSYNVLFIFPAMLVKQWYLIMKRFISKFATLIVWICALHLVHFSTSNEWFVHVCLFQTHFMPLHWTASWMFTKSPLYAIYLLQYLRYKNKWYVIKICNEAMRKIQDITKL